MQEFMKKYRISKMAAYICIFICESFFVLCIILAFLRISGVIGFENSYLITTSVFAGISLFTLAIFWFFFKKTYEKTSKIYRIYVKNNKKYYEKLLKKTYWRKQVKDWDKELEELNGNVDLWIKNMSF